MRINKIIDEIKITLDAEDLGRAFYNLILYGFRGLKLIDFSTATGENNTFQVATELTYKNGNDEFRPDITVLINGLPLSFIEVKKPNNKDGIQAEYNRINVRFRNRKFKKFVNIIQFMVFSNNNQYDDNEIIPFEGAFYATSSYNKLFFNHFREEEESIFSSINPIDNQKEIDILRDTNHISIKYLPEYLTNLIEKSSTNKILTSLYSKDRIMFILKYAIAYVERVNDQGIINIEKHIMRYPQLFATKAIQSRLDCGMKNGVIWHTQGSGKTALVFFNIRSLTDYYQRKGIIAKFYFIVDRLDLLTQAADEFRARGLFVEEINSREDFIINIRSNNTTNNTGRNLITIVNIQKFSEESIVTLADYNVDVQRIYFLDEAHRSYKPTGSFLANLLGSDNDAVIIALTGTPLIIPGKKTEDIFGQYIHKYYYNRSIADRYTLRLIREGIETTYKKKLEQTLENIETLRGSITKEELFSHQKYVKVLVKYIIDDFDKSRTILDDNSIGAMIVCDSSKQARAIFEEIKESKFSSALILHDEDDSVVRRLKRNEFRNGEIDFLIVYNMLLTGFDAPRLKKMYLGRLIKDHSLLQALTRVNRPYNKFRYGYVVDFADIRSEFDKTNKAYFEELQAELGDEFKQYNNIFKTVEEIENNLKEIVDKLFIFETENAEIFSKQVSKIEDKMELIDLREALLQYKELFNISKIFGYEGLMEKFNLSKVNILFNEVNNRINLINLKNRLHNLEDMSLVLNIALDEIDFSFKKISENEMIIADKFRDSLELTRKAMQRNLDPKDPEYVSLLEELQRLLSKKHIEELNAEEMTENISILNKIRKLADKKNLVDQMLVEKYDNDPKFMRTHKRLKESPPSVASEAKLYRILINLKHNIDNQVISNKRLLNNEPYFINDIYRLVKQELDRNEVQYTIAQIKFIGSCISNEYINERDWVN